MMYGPLMWCLLWAPLPVRMLLLCIFFSAKLSVLDCQCQPFSSPATSFSHVQLDGFQQGRLFAEGERCNRVLLQYCRAQLFKMTPARLTLDMISHLRTMQIGVDLSRKRSRRGGRRKQKQSNLNEHLSSVSLSLIERSISDDRDLLVKSRLEIPVRITDHVHHAATVRQSCVNCNNLISITKQHSRVSVNRSQSSLKLLFFFNSQPCRQIATDIYDLIVDNSIDVLMLTETWLYSNGDEAYIAAMTPAGYEFRSFPRTGSRGGGIGSTFQNTFQKFHCVCVWV